jgi:hypothetical protein
MEHKKPIVAAMVVAFSANALLDAHYGVRLFTDLPPMAAVTAGSSFSGVTNLPIYSTVTDDRIEAPAPEKDRAGQI